MSRAAVHNCNLNIRYDLPDEQWEKIAELYTKMPGWIGYLEGIPHWFGEEDDEVTISASVEPSGLLLYARMGSGDWEKWLESFKAQAAEALGYPIGEPEDGFL